MASWQEERDRLVEQTRAFVAGVAAAVAPARGRAVPVAEAMPGKPAQAAGAIIAVAPTPAISVNGMVAPGMPPRLKPAAEAVSERAEIIQRVAAFRAHQTRLIREREAFYEATQSKIRNVLGNEFKPGPL